MGNYDYNSEKMVGRLYHIETANFKRQVQSAQERLEMIESCANQFPTFSKELLQEAIAELSIALEELHLTTEELQEQNEELLATQQALASESKRYQMLFEFAPDGYLVTNAQGTIREANKAAAILLNIKTQFMVGKPLTVFVPLEDRTTFYAKLSQINDLGGKLTDWEVRLQPRKRKAFPAAITVATVRDSQSELIELRWLIRDISQRKQAEAIILNHLAQQQELNKLQTRFLSTVAHEFRTPLTTILAAAFVLSTSIPTKQKEKAQRNYQKIKAAVGHMNRLVEDILVFDKAKTGNLEFNPTPINLELFCRTLIEEEKLSCGNDRTIQFRSSGNCSDVYLDAKLLKQFLGNLLSNALKYSPQDSPVEFELISESSQVTFYIRDRGIGIPLPDQPHLFEPFYRAENVGNIPGTGLGLAIVKKAVESHRGTISFISEFGVGTTFTVILPF
ncbi:MAG TPA: PAS domain-containing sensor histidine kinase [Cyanobacteria bacterium UBA8803]|nr:PAS domain-containing sensor histidine kinase [Cyanobacteria bacterium UBA9273]HBL60734.1 PAS domain-containing sensor histidine kinase [Cyanobacteria bacterium UBA8803]